MAINIPNPARREQLEGSACISAESKELLALAFPQHSDLITFITDTVTTCAFEGVPVGRKKSGVKRAPSAYNIFVGECLKRRPSGQQVTEAMKGCAVEWKAKKAKA